MDSALKELVREERRRRSERNEKDRNERDKHRKDDGRDNDRHHHRSRKDRSEKKERKDKPDKNEKPDKIAISESVVITETDPAETVTNTEMKETNKAEILPIPNTFMFLYEDNAGNLFNSLNKIETIENNKIKIFPVYFSGYENSMSSEEITFISGKWTPTEENKESSWLNIINDTSGDNTILPFDFSEIVLYNGNLFHCEDDLYDYIELYGADVLNVN
jgi:hypothetical protein